MFPWSYVQYPKNLHNFHNDLPFLPERVKTENLKWKWWKNEILKLEAFS